MLVLLAYHAYLCVGGCAYCRASREEIAQLKAEGCGIWRRRRRGGRGGVGRIGIEEEQGLVTREVVPQEMGMRDEVVEGRSYGTLSP